MLLIKYLNKKNHTNLKLQDSVKVKSPTKYCSFQVFNTLVPLKASVTGITKISNLSKI